MIRFFYFCFLFLLVYWRKAFGKHTSAAIIPHLMTYLDGSKVLM